MTFTQAIRDAVARAKTVTLAASKRARRIRDASEFDIKALTPTWRSPIVPSAAWAWTLPEIMNARDAQMQGQFSAPYELAKSMRTNGAMFSAWANRLAPQRRLAVEVLPGRGPNAARARAEGEALFGNEGVALHEDTMSDVVSDLASHGLAIGCNQWTPRRDGSRIDVEMKVWPIKYVWYNAAARCLMTRIDPFPTQDASTFGADSTPHDNYGNPNVHSTIVPIVHGDGRWTVFSKHAEFPWTKDAVLLPAAMIWGAIAYAERDWSKGSSSHGSPKTIGELPEAFDLDTSKPEVQTFMALLADIATGENPFGIKPFGSKIEVLANPSDMHAVFRELYENREKLSHRIWTGTDAALGSQGGAPGIDVAALFGVSENIASGDLRAIERGLLTGVSEPHAAINYGTSECASRRRYVLPDSDADAARESFAKRIGAFNTAIKDLRANGFVISADLIEELADKFDVPVPAAPIASTRGSDIYQYEIEDGIFTIDEVRGNKGFAPLSNGRGSRTYPEVQAQADAAASAPAPLSVVR